MLWKSTRVYIYIIYTYIQNRGVPGSTPSSRSSLWARCAKTSDLPDILHDLSAFANVCVCARVRAYCTFVSLARSLARARSLSLAMCIKYGIILALLYLYTLYWSLSLTAYIYIFILGISLSLALSLSPSFSLSLTHTHTTHALLALCECVWVCLYVCDLNSTNVVVWRVWSVCVKFVTWTAPTSWLWFALPLYVTVSLSLCTLTRCDVWIQTDKHDIFTHTYTRNIHMRERERARKRKRKKEKERGREWE